MSQDTTRRPWGWAYVHSPLTASVCIGERCPADMQGLPNVKPVFLEQQARAVQDAGQAEPLTDAQLEQERRLFERKCANLNMMREPSGAYSLQKTQVAWAAWWAARQVSAGIASDAAKRQQC